MLTKSRARRRDRCERSECPRGALRRIRTQGCDRRARRRARRPRTARKPSMGVRLLHPRCRAAFTDTGRATSSSWHAVAAMSPTLRTTGWGKDAVQLRPLHGISQGGRLPVLERNRDPAPSVLDGADSTAWRRGCGCAKSPARADPGHRSQAARPSSTASPPSAFRTPAPIKANCPASLIRAWSRSIDAWCGSSSRTSPASRCSSSSPSIPMVSSVTRHLPASQGRQQA